MATNRYGQIYHGDYHHINIRFPSTEARLKFQNEFEAYHQGHDHEGDIPTFKCVSSKDLKLSTGSRSPQDLVKAETDENYRITIDGYSWNEIHEYHNPTGWKDSFWYSVPTCCVPPIIVIDHKFVDAGTLQRHELSAIFGDMPDTDFQSLLDSVQTDGFIDPIIRIHEGQILDGWHRYRAAQELNLIRKLKFQQWNEDEKKDGDPKAFVLARNIERRHLAASQRAQIAVVFNERFGHGGDRSKMQDCNLKTQKELADQANVSKRTIATAVQVERAGRSEDVIAGEKTASEVLQAENRKKARARAEKERRALWAAYNNDERFGDEDDPEGFAIAASKAIGVSEMEGRFIYEAGKDEIDELSLETAETWGQRFRQIRRDIEAGAAWVVAYQARLTEREANKLLKKKKHALKSMWDARIQVSRDYGGEDDNDLNQYLTIEQFEEGFARYHKDHADAFKSGMKRINTGKPGSFHIFQEKALETDVSLQDLEGEAEVINIYAHDISHWVDCDWIQQMIQWKKDALEKHHSLTPPETETSDAKETDEADTFKTLREQVKAEIPKWKQRYKESGKKESELVSRASFSMLIHVFREWDEASGPATEENAATAEELKEILRLLKTNSFVFIYRLRQYLRKTDASDKSSTDAEPETDVPKDEDIDVLSDAVESFDKIFLNSGYLHTDYERLADVASSALDCDRDIFHLIVFNEDLPEGFSANDVRTWTAIVHRLIADFKANAEWTLKVKNVEQREEPESDAAGFSEIDIHAMRNTLSSLLETLGIDDSNRNLQESLGGDLLDVFLQYEELPTAKEQLIALLNTADAILSEMIP